MRIIGCNFTNNGRISSKLYSSPKKKSKFLGTNVITDFENYEVANNQMYGCIRIVGG